MKSVLFPLYRLSGRTRLAGRLGALGAGLAAAVTAWANVPGGGSQGPDVTLTLQGNNVLLSNGIISATINTRTAEVNSLLFKGRDMVNRSGKSHMYFSRDGGTTYENLAHCVCSVTTRTPDTVDISCKHVYTPGAGDKAAWDVDAHFVLRRGATGLYVYTINSHPASYPALSVGEWRLVWPMPAEGDNWLLEKVYIDELRHWTLASAGDYRRTVPVTGAPKEVTQFTSGPWNGKYDCKYVYVGIYSDLGCWGYASDKNHLGGWFVFGNHEYFTNGPMKQDLTATQGSLNLVHLNMNHYGGTAPAFDAGQEWQKVYGPFLIYCNDQASGDECWKDAQEQAKAEASAWPYAWLKHPAYPAATERGGVTGRFVVRDALKPEVAAANAWVGLALPDSSPEGNFQYQGAGYQYWVRAGADGRFSIANVRPGAYTLYAFTNGAVGEFSRANVTVQAGALQPLGDVTWQVPHHGTKIAWEIGVPDRRSTEFKHGDDYFQPMLFWTMPKEFPNPLEYFVGQSDWRKDWNYAQSYYYQGSQEVPHPWRIHFRLDAAPRETATLTVAIAGSHQAGLNIAINGSGAAIPLKHQGGNALVRETDHAKYEVIYVPIAAGLLQAGENTITLTQTSVRGDQSSIMYDYLNLELP